MPKRVVLSVVALVVLAILAVAGLRAVRSAHRRPNVLLISMDTTRADHLGCYRPGLRTSPNIDALAAEAVLFENVISPKPLTLPAHSSMMTGRIPPCHGVHDNLTYRLGESMVTLAESLKSAGYATAAFVGAFILDHKFGLAQGFDVYDDHMGEDPQKTDGFPERTADVVTKSALEWLEANAAHPFFLFVHFYDPHHPYRPPGRYGSVFADDPYSGEIAYADEHVGQLLDFLRQRGLYDSTVIIVTGDHGEGLGDHGETLHGYFVYHSTTRVPLIIKPAGKTPAGRVASKVGTIDITPTVLASAGVPVSMEMNGQSLTPFLSGAGPPTQERYLYSDSMTATKYGCSALLAVETMGWKYIHTAKPEVYDLASDPNEKNNVFEAEQKRGLFMKSQLAAVLEECQSMAQSGALSTVDAADLERARQLGYTGGMVTEDFDLDTAKDKEDPKDFLPIHSKIEAVEYHVNHDNPAMAREAAVQVLAERSDIAVVHGMLGRLALKEQDEASAIQHFSKALELQPDNLEWTNSLGNLYSRGGRFEEALERYNQAMKLATTRSAGVVLDEAHVTQLSNLHMNLGTLWMRWGQCEDTPGDLSKCEQAVVEYREALRLRPSEPGLHFHLGRALAATGRPTEAMAELRKTLEQDPSHAGARRELDKLEGKNP